MTEIEATKHLKTHKEYLKHAWKPHPDYNVLESISMAINALEKKQNNGWIPVSDRLPEEAKAVLVWYEYFRYGDYNCMYQTYGIGYQFDGHWSGDISGTKARCIAWMELPPPFNEK